MLTERAEFHICTLKMISAWIGTMLLLTSIVDISEMKSCTTRLLISGLVTNCASCGLREVPHKAEPCTAELLLNSNALHTIKEHDLKEFVNLTVLDLSQNHISSLHPRCFRGLFKLQRLNLNHNNLHTMGYGVFPRGIFNDLISLRVLTAVGYNTYEGEYPIDSLVDLPSLEVLSLSLLINRTIPARLTELSELRVLDFFAGFTTAITRQLIDGIRTSSIESIAFRNIKNLTIIEKGAFSNFPSLRTINLACCSALSHNNVVASLGQTVNTSVDTVILDGISANGVFGHFNSEDFCREFWTNVTRLSLRKNNIVSLKFRDNWCMRKLTQLILSYNMPLFIEPRTPNGQDFAQMPNLRVVDVSYISVTGPHFRDEHCNRFPAAMSYEANSYFPPSPPIIYTQKNYTRRAYTIKAGYRFVQIPPSLERAYLRYWRSTLIKFPSKDIVLAGGENISYINISNSMILKSINFTVYGIYNLLIADLSYGILEYISPVMFNALPNLRFLNLSHNSFGTSGTDFRGTFSSLLELEDINLSSNHLQTLHVDAFATCTKLRNVNLRKNVLQNVHFDIANLTRLELLDLSSNQITTIEEPFMSTLDALQDQTDYRLNLTNNPFICKCHPVNFVRWIQTTSVKIINRDKLTCTYNGIESSIVSIPLEEYEETCRETSAWLWFVIAPSCLCFLILVVAVFLVRYHRWYITYHLTMCTARRKCAADDNEHHKCDVMIVYFTYAVTEADWDACEWISDWVCNYLQPRAETQWGLQLYIGDRDDKPGATKTENFLYGFSISEKVVVCVTSSLSNDAQLGNHFNLALASKKPLSNYIFIIFDNALLDTHNKVLQRLLEPDSPAAHLYWVEGSTKIEQDKFWKTLRYALIKDSKDSICPGAAI